MHKDVQQELDINFGIDQTFTNSESSTFIDIASEIEDIVSNVCRIGSLSERETALSN